MRDWIELEDFTVDAVLGVLEREQRTTQPLQIGLRLELDLSGAAGGDLTQSLDYAAVLSWTTTLVQVGQWRLLESMGQAVCALLLLPPVAGAGRAQVEAVQIRLRKPTILDGAAVPGVGLSRQRGEWTLSTRYLTDGVHVDVLCETPLTGAYRLVLAPGASWTPPEGVTLEAMAGSATWQGRPLAVGARLGRGQGGTIHNPGGQPAALLAVARPPLG